MEEEEGDISAYHSNEWLDRVAALNIKHDAPDRKTHGYRDLYSECRSVSRMGGQYSPYKDILSLGVAEYGRDPEICAATTKKGSTMYHYRDVFDVVVDYIDEFEDHIEYFKSDATKLGCLSTFITQLRGRTRSDDLSRVKTHLSDYIHIPVTPSGNKDILERSCRGWNDTHGCATLLVPIGKEYDEFLLDPAAYCKKMNEGRHKLRSDNFPRAFYDLEMLAEDPDVPLEDALHQ
ncbi:uncharacterized protein BXZ73DRAFT_108093 [Epithele typhae]|uniref:uncharacterized protein n=1 Tax=Epithele typhae TaxID=378194 RepID=UPI0020077AD2|nr:uncharacterized protein BXZ73DRAFT_108093 [Epithele typhae]KAH9911328.1 hypothetical protein BXZ73DRAFT_108093 [Epithele typhae]